MNENDCDHDCEACWKRSAEEGMRKGIEAIKNGLDKEIMKAVCLYVDEMKSDNPFDIAKQIDKGDEDE